MKEEFKIGDIDIRAENKRMLKQITEATNSALQCGGHGCHSCGVDDAKPDHPRCITCRHYPRKCNWVPLGVPRLIPKNGGG